MCSNGIDATSASDRVSAGTQQMQQMCSKQMQQMCSNGVAATHVLDRVFARTKHKDSTPVNHITHTQHQPKP
jgi:hypothetical protein